MGGRRLGPPLSRTVVLTAGLALVLLVVAWLLTDPETSGRKGREAQRLTAQLLGKDGVPDLTSADDVRHYLAAHRDDVGLVSYALGPGGTAADPAVHHQQDEPAPVASAIKIIHLAAYAAAVGAGRLDPAERVRLADWTAYLVPGTDGGAHPAALNRLGVRGTEATLTLDQLVSAMIVESDNAAADYLRARLGESALLAAARAAGGPVPARAPSLNGQLLLTFGACGVRQPHDQRWQLAEECLREYVTASAGARRRLAPATAPPLAAQAAWAERTAPIAPATLAALLAAIVSDRYVSPEVSAIARRHLEWQTRGGPINDRVARLGAKGGSLPGVLSEASYAVGRDGRTRVTVLSLRRVPLPAWTVATRAYALQQFTLRLAGDPAYVEKVRRSL